VIPVLNKLADDSNTTCSALDLQVLIKYMTRDRGLAICDGKVIKLEHTVGDALSPITEEEKGIVNVKDTYSRLESQIEEIERRIKERQTKIESLLREKKRDQALSYLRSRRMLDKLLEKRTKSLETLHGVLIKIEQAASDVEIIKAYELSTSSLKVLLSNERLQPDRIDQSMEQMQDTLASADEVRRAIEVGNDGVRAAAGEEEMDDAEMEAELKKMEEEARQEQLQKEQEREKMAELEKEQQQRKQSEAVKSDLPQSKKLEEQRTAILTQ
jgi:charged multivesicular body protein 7